MDHIQTFGETPVHRRAFARLRTKYPAKLILLSDNLKGYLLDLSETGAKVILDDCDVLHGEGVLQWAGFEVFGKVSWTKDSICGFEFLEDLSANAVQTTRALPHWSEDLELESCREFLRELGQIY